MRFTPIVTTSTTRVSDPVLDTDTLEHDSHVLVMGLNRPEKRNAFNVAVLAISRALTHYSNATSACGPVSWSRTASTSRPGSTLSTWPPYIAAGRSPIPDDGRDPWRLDGEWTKPVVAPAQGRCLTLGIELLLAADIRIAAADARFAQIEVLRGIYPFGGATIRLPRQTGWGNAMRWLLIGDEFDAAEAQRIGLVQEVAPDAAAAEATPVRSPTRSPIVRRPWVSVPRWRRRNWPSPRGTPPRSIGCARRCHACSAPRTRTRACSPSSTQGGLRCSSIAKGA